MWELSNVTRWVTREASYVGRREAIHSAATPSLGAAERDVLLPASSAPTNRALNHEVRRDSRILALHQTGVDKRQTPNPGEA
jgi:hypothetical protein